MLFSFVLLKSILTVRIACEHANAGPLSALSRQHYMLSWKPYVGPTCVDQFLLFWREGQGTFQTTTMVNSVPGYSSTVSVQSYVQRPRAVFL